jgi:AAHS family 4-hydroxybenzoate transporter-like MFS transporter
MPDLNAQSSSRQVDVRMQPLQFLVAGLCLLTVLIDGFDTQAAAFAGPLLKREFAGGSQALGMIFGMGMIGGLLGAWLFGPLGDRFGRKPLIIAALAIISLGSVAGGMAGSAFELALLRLFTGFGLGGAVPNVIALVAEYAPPRLRSTMVAVVFSGFPLGAMLGSILGAHILPRFGWRVLFMMGGIIPALALILVALLLPESLQILKRLGRLDHLQRLIARLGDMATLLVESDATPQRSHSGSIRRLFADGLAPSTILIWIGTFVSMLCLYCTVNWLPTLISGEGLPLQTAILAVGALNIGSILGNIVLARIADRAAPYLPTAAFYAVGAIFLTLIGLSKTSSGLMLTMAFVGGLFAFGAQLSVTTITARLYPAEIRATGIGWAFGVGRIGASIGPIAAGVLFDTGTSFAVFMAEIGMLELLAGITIFFLGRTRQARGKLVAGPDSRSMLSG